MVNLILKNNTGRPYAEARDAICKQLRGNRGYIENDIVVSDCNANTNEIFISLGDDCTDALIVKGAIESTDLEKAK